jgi:hypothetical protein
MSVHEEIPQHVALKMQLAAIAGNEPADSFFELRPFGPNMEPAPDERAFVPVRAIGEVIGRIGRLAARFNVFVGVAPRVREGGTEVDVQRVWTLWVDCDSPEALERLHSFEPQPSIVVLSGSGGAHGYWPLREPLPPPWAQRANRRLALALGADRASTDPARILRAVGTLNHKHHPARVVRCTRLEIEAFTWAEVVGSLPDDRDYQPPRRALQTVRCENPSRIIAGLVEFLAGRAEGERNKALFWTSCRLREHADRAEVDLDAGLAEIRPTAVKLGLPEHEIEKTIASGLAAGARST